MAFTDEYKELKLLTEQIISERIEGLSKYPEPLLSSIKYSLTDGGKRMRPVLFLQAHRMFSGGDIPLCAAHIAFAIECIHTYSLIHDDLPAMDNDSFRRGKPTNHKVFGEGIAILAGDALLNLAYESLFTSISLVSVNFMYIKAARRIAHLCGGEGLIGGQTLDIFASEEGLTPQILNYIYSHKTADLIEAALHAGALTGGANDKNLKAFSKFAQCFGYAFQIKDDILDYKGGIAHNIKSYVDFYGIENSEQKLNELIDASISALDEIDADTTFFKEFAKDLISREF